MIYPIFISVLRRWIWIYRKFCGCHIRAISCFSVTLVMAGICMTTRMSLHIGKTIQIHFIKFLSRKHASTLTPLTVQHMMTQTGGLANSAVFYLIEALRLFARTNFCISDTGRPLNIWTVHEDVCDSYQTFLTKFAVIIGVFYQIWTRKLIFDNGQIFQIRWSVNPLI